MYSPLSMVSLLPRGGIPEGNSSITPHGELSSFDPASATGFDFTPLFENTILSIIPSGLLLLALPYRISILQGRRPKVAHGGILHDSKQLFLVVFAAMNLALLTLHVLTPSQRTGTSVAAAALAFVGSLGLCVLSHLEHVRSLRPSPIINGYLLLTMVFDIARARTLFITDASRSIAGCFASVIGVKAMVLLAEAIEKRDLLLDPYRGLSPEETSGIYSKSVFFWLNQLMRNGFRSLLQNHDLYPIDREMRSEVLQMRMQHAWSAAPHGCNHALFWALLKANHKALAYCILPRLIQIGFRYTQPFLLTRTISFANDLSQPEEIGWGLTGAFFIVLLGLAVANGFYYHMTYRFVTSVRGSLISIIYAKTVDLSITALNESVAVTLMSSDTQTICNGLRGINDFWAVPLELAIALYLLARQLGVACVASAFLSAISAICIFAIAKFTAHAQEIWMQSIQTRVHVTTAMLDSMKSVKMLGFSDWLKAIIQSLRVAELAMAGRFRKLVIVRVFLANILITLAPFVTFFFFTLRTQHGNPMLNAESAYTALSLIALLASPVNDMIIAIPSINAAIASLNRIQLFLESDSRRDDRLFLGGGANSRPTDSLLQEEGLELLDRTTPVSQIHSQVIIGQNVSFSWTQDDDEPVVRNINFSVSLGQVCLIIGPVGCGKSTLLKGILGETLSKKGFLYIASQEAAFVDQTPWIRNTSFQDNIVGVSTYDDVWYKEVVRACALDQDVSLLPNGHLTKVGTSGISLSGGQKQRLALARAVYARKDIILLDDVFSGLDADTEERIFTQLFSQRGLFRKLYNTVLLVTHAVHRLAYADHIIAMKHDGSIAEQGTLEQLEAAGGYVAQLRARSRVGNSEDETQLHRQQQNTTAGIPPGREDDMDELGVAEEDSARQHGDLSLYSYYFGSVHWASTVLWVTCFVLYGVSTKLSEFLVNIWTNALEQQGSSVNDFYLGLYGMLAALTTFSLVGGAYHLILYFTPTAAKVLHERLLCSVMNAPLSFFTSVDIGTTMNRFSQDMTLIDIDLPYSVTDFVLSLSSGLMSAVLMCVSARYFVATLPPVFLFMWTLQKYYLRTSRQMRLLDLEAKSPLFSQFIESLSGLVTIRAFGWASIFEKQNLVLLDASQKPFYLLFCIQRWLELALDLTVTGLSVILMVMIVKLRSEVGAGYVGLAILNVITFSQSLSDILRNWTNLETSIGAIARIRAFVATTANENRPEENLQVLLDSAGSASPSTTWPPMGAIEFHNVSASYKTGSNQKLAIRNLSMSIRAGEKVGICGRSGSGKSSLLATLFRMLEVEPGSRITVDGADITRIPRQQLRAALNAIPQEPFFTRGTVRANVDPSGMHSADQIEAALRCVELWDIIQPKGGLDADLDANFFSHGQRQLFCLARALLRGGTVIVLDEVTSNVDVVSDALMQRVIREQFAHCTILAVSHRLDTIMDFDRVALMRDGELIEFDTPQALLSHDSAFKELYEAS